MRTLTIAALLIAALPACSAPYPAAEATMALNRQPLDDALVLSKTRVNKPVKGRPTFQAPLPIPGHNAVLVPFARESVAGLFGTRTSQGIGDRDHFAEGGSSRRDFAGGALSDLRSISEVPVRWHNAVLHDFDAGTQALALDTKGIISRYWMRLDRPNKKSPWKMTALLFGVTLEDTNGDGVLDDEDAMSLAVMGPSGSRVVTGPGANLVTLLFDQEGDRALAYLVMDSNGNGEFDLEEGPVPYVVDLLEDGMAEPLVEERTRQLIDRALDAVE